MTTKTIRHLNHLNQDFYQKIAADFDDSRQYAWPGWQRFLPYVTNKTLSLLDVGCGNGRLAQFWAEKLPDTKLHYTGVDSNSDLLQKAETKLNQLQLNYTLLKVDLVASLLNHSFSSQIGTEEYSLVTLLGIIHHIPSFKLRLQLLQECASRVNRGGLLAVAVWKFLEFDRLKSKLVNPAKTGFQSRELEPHDYFMTWEKGQSATRYCHFLDDQEETRLISALTYDGSLKLLTTYRDDGKEGNVNQYLLFQKQ